MPVLKIQLSMRPSFDLDGLVKRRRTRTCYNITNVSSLDVKLLRKEEIMNVEKMPIPKIKLYREVIHNAK